MTFNNVTEGTGTGIPYIKAIVSRMSVWHNKWTLEIRRNKK